MKFTPILLATVMATAGIAAQAASGETQPTDNNSATVQRHDDGRTLGQKMRDGAHKVADGTKRLFHRGKEDAQQARNDVKAKSRDKDARHDDTRAMGAGRANDDAANDTSRRQRMDDAYANYKRQGEKH